MQQSSWYYFAPLRMFHKKKITTFFRFNDEFIGFLDQNGHPKVYSAFCPHLGGHLGVGGKIENNEIICPFHGWHYNFDGACTKIPYCERIPPRAKLDALLVRKSHGHVFVCLAPTEENVTTNPLNLPFPTEAMPHYLYGQEVTSYRLRHLLRLARSVGVQIMRHEKSHYHIIFNQLELDGKLSLMVTPTSSAHYLLTFILVMHGSTRLSWRLKIKYRQKLKTLFGVKG